MALPIFQRTVVNDNGDIIPNAQIEVRLESSGALATVYSDRDGLTVVSNPFFADSNGFVNFYANPDEYRIDATSGSFVAEWRYVLLVSAGDSTVTANSISELLTASKLFSVNVLNYHSDTQGGGGVFYWDAAGDKADHNGGTVIDPDVTFPVDWSDTAQQTTWFTANTGAGVWRRQYDGEVNVSWFGAKGDGVADDTIMIQAVFDVFNNIKFETKKEYKITNTLNIVPPFEIDLNGSSLNFDSFGILKNGIEIGKANGSGLFICSVKNGFLNAISANGKNCITTPKGTDVFNTYVPTYIFKNLIFKGGQESLKEGLYDYGWKRYLDIGDGRNHILENIQIYGVYDYSKDISTQTLGVENTGIWLSGIAGQGGVLLPRIEGFYGLYLGEGIRFDYQVSQPIISDSQIHRSYLGINSPNLANGNEYGFLEGQFDNININTQLVGLNIEQSAFLDINAVRSTRAEGGFNHSNTWYGFKIKNTDDLKMRGLRGYNTSETYTNANVGMLLENCDFVSLDAYVAAQNLTRGLILKDSNRITIDSPFFRSGSVSAIYFQYTSLIRPLVTISNDRYTSNIIKRVIFDSAIEREAVEFIGGKTVFQSVDNSIQGITASNATENISVDINNQILRRQLNTSASAHSFNFEKTNAREGDNFIIHLKTVLGFSGSIYIKNDGDEIWSASGIGGNDYCINIVFTEGDWFLLNCNLVS